MTKLARGAVALATLIALSGALATPAGAAKVPVRYYLALGDSLSQGVQPNAAGTSVETNQGYVNDLYAALAKKIPHLKLLDVGCPGDTTGSLLTGTGNSSAASVFKCDRKHGSQLKAALAFLKSHHAKGEVPLITIDIGANDVDGCVSESNVLACVSAGVKSIKTNTPKILDALRKAAPKGTTLAAMNLYDPVLAYELQPYSPIYPLASLSVSLLQGINAAIASADSAAKFRTADVATAFATYDTTDMVPYNGALVPKDVAEVCTLTWACTPPPQGPNIHANAQGYQLIANTFEAILPSKL